MNHNSILKLPSSYKNVTQKKKPQKKPPKKCDSTNSMFLYHYPIQLCSEVNPAVFKKVFSFLFF